MILATQRTGTKLLVNLLRSHSRIVCFNEIFYKDDSPLWGFNKIDTETYRLAIKHPVEYVNQYYFRNYSDNVKAVGFKLMYNQLSHRKAKKLMDVFDNQKDLIIHLKRKNKLKTFLSSKLIEITNRATQIRFDIPIRTLNKKSVNVVPILISKNEFVNYVERTQKLESQFDDLIKNKRHLTIFYHELARNYMTEVNKIIKTLNIPEEVLVCINTKINNKPLSEAIINYDELKNQLHNTKYEVFFEE